MNQGSRQWLLRRGPLRTSPCPVTTRRDGQIIIETSWGQQIGFPFQSGDGENLQCLITTGSQPLIGPWPVLKRTALTAFVEENRCQCCGIKKKRIHYTSEKRWLSYFSNTWHQLENNGRSWQGTCSNLSFICLTTKELHFDVFWSHTGWIIVNIICKSIKSAGPYAKQWGWFQSIYWDKTIICWHKKVFIYQYFFHLLKFPLALITDCFQQSLRKLSKTLPEIISQKTLIKIKCKRWL